MEDPSYSSIVGSCHNYFWTWNSTKHLENIMLKGITSSETTSSSIYVMIVIEDSPLLDFGGICDFDLFNLFSKFLFFASESPSPSNVFKCSFYASSFFVRKYAINFWCFSSIVFSCLSISMSLVSCALVIATFSSNLGKAMVFIIGEEWVVATKAFLLHVLTTTKIHKLWILWS